MSTERQASTGAPAIRILVADDHPVVRDGLVAMLGTQPDFHVVGSAGDGVETVEKAARLSPDIILLDLEMPGLDGVEAIRRIRESRPEAQAIVFTAFDTDERILGALRSGAKGYLLKGAPREELFHAIRVVSAGGSLLQPVVTSRLLRHLSSEEELEPLTSRELEVLGHLALGKSNRKIAEELFITERTVKFHVSSLLAKLGAANRTEAVRIAAHRGLIEL